MILLFVVGVILSRGVSFVVLLFFSLIFVLVGAGVCVSKKELLWNAVGLLLCGFAGGGDCGFDVVEALEQTTVC